MTFLGASTRQVWVTGLALVAAAALAAGFVIAHRSASEGTRLVGARGVALAVPVSWKSEVQEGSFCAAMEPHTVEFYTPLQDDQGVGSCAVPTGGSWPAEDSLSVYTDPVTPRSARRHANRTPSGMVGGMPYYLLDGHMSGPGVARQLVIPAVGVDFLAGAATREAADRLLETVRAVPPGTNLR